MFHNAFLPVWNHNWFANAKVWPPPIPLASVSPLPYSARSRLLFYASLISSVRLSNGLIRVLATPSSTPDEPDEILACCMWTRPHEPLSSSVPTLLKSGFVRLAWNWGWTGIQRVAIAFEGTNAKLQEAAWAKRKAEGKGGATADAAYLQMIAVREDLKKTETSPVGSLVSLPPPVSPCCTKFKAMREPRLGDTFKIITWGREEDHLPWDVEWYQGVFNRTPTSIMKERYYSVMAEGYNDGDRIQIFIQREWREDANHPQNIERHGTVKDGWIHLTIDKSFRYGSWQTPEEWFGLLKNAGPPNWFLVYHDTQRNPFQLSLSKRVHAFLQTQVTPGDATYQLLWACFLTGYTCAITFSATFIWCGFQTGGTIQLALALARLFTGDPATRTYEFEQPDRQALTSLLGFLLGTSVGRVGDKVGPKKRVWLGIVGKRLATEFATCVVLTTIWVELINDPKLFARTHVKSRDHKAGAILMLFIGGLVARCILDTIGAASALGIGAGMRVLGAAWWMWTR
ncbi:hypothetical protein RQP46_001361 [Phenoliferia psychrophenolica]